MRWEKAAKKYYKKQGKIFTMKKTRVIAGNAERIVLLSMGRGRFTAIKRDGISFFVVP